MFRIQFLLVVFLSVFILQSHQAVSQENFPGSSVVESAMANLQEANLKFKHLVTHQDSDPEAIFFINNMLESTIMDIAYLGDLLKQHRSLSGGGLVQAEVACKRCKGSGSILAEGGGSKPCPKCNGDGWVWTPSASGNEKKCGRCRGSGYVGENQVCPICDGSGWAHSQADPPPGWSENGSYPVGSH